MIDTVLASLTLAVCLGLLVRMALPSRWRFRLDATLRRGWSHGRHSAGSLWRWRSHRRDAERVAQEVIRRAQRGSGVTEREPWQGEREGNVYKPKAFKRPRKPH